MRRKQMILLFLKNHNKLTETTAQSKKQVSELTRMKNKQAACHNAKRSLAKQVVSFEYEC